MQTGIHAQFARWRVGTALARHNSVTRVLQWRTSAPATWFGNAIWIAFVSVQATDAVLTYVGVLHFGLAVEANPIVASSLMTLGPSTGLFLVKLSAIGCAAFLHAIAQHHVVGLLTIVFLLGAVSPWVQLLWP